MSESVRHVVREIYCEVLFELAEEAGAVDTVMDDIASVESILRQEPEFAAMMTSPQIKGAEKSRIIRRVFGSRISDLTLDFLSVLAKRNRMGNLFDISMKYESLMDKHYDRHPVEVILAEKPDQTKLDELKLQIEEAIGRQAKLLVEVDPSIVGGIIIKKDGKVIDNSVASLLERAVSDVVEKSRHKEGS